MDALASSSPLIGIVLSWPTEWLIFGLLVVIFTFDSVIFGSGKSTALVIAYPIALFLYNAAQSAIVIGATMQQFASSVQQLVIFALFLAAAWWLVHRSISVFYAPAPITLALLSG